MSRVQASRHHPLPIVDYALHTLSPEAIAEAQRVVAQEKALAEYRVAHSHGDAFCSWKDRLETIGEVERFLEMLGGGVVPPEGGEG